VDQPVFANNSEAIQPADDWMYVKLRYKQPDADTSQLITQMAGQSSYTATPDNDFLFASAVSEFALLLKDSDYVGDANYDSLIARAESARGEDPGGYRAQFLQLAALARQLYQH
jgi:Ca-activated chloride channel family protein